MKKLLLFDLDGTLLTSDKRITMKTKEALWSAREKGYLIGVSTSRSLVNSRAFTDEIEPDILIASGGAIVLSGKEVLFCQELTAEETQDLIERSREVLGSDFEITIDTEEEHYANFIEKYDSKEASWGKDIYCDFQNWDSPSLKVCIRITEEEKLRILKESFPDLDAIRFSEEYWYKFTAKGITKENAAKVVCDDLSMSFDDITAFGDDLADVGMLKRCGKGIAMGNALPAVKEAADLVIGSNDEDGIAVYLEDLLSMQHFF